MRFSNCSVLIGPYGAVLTEQGRFYSPHQKDKPRTFVIVDSACINKQGIVREAESSFWGSFQCTEYMSSLCQQMAIRLLLIKISASVDHEESISADKFLLEVHIKWIFLRSTGIRFNWRFKRIRLGGSLIGWPWASNLISLTHFSIS